MRNQKSMSSLDFDSFEEMKQDEEIRAMVYRATSRYIPYLDADDIESEVNYTLFRVWELHDANKSKVSTYLYNSLYNNLNRMLKKKYRAQTILVNEDVFPSTLSVEDPISNEVLDSLDDLEKDIVVCHSLYKESFTSLGKKHKIRATRISEIYKNSLSKMKKDCFG